MRWSPVCKCILNPRDTTSNIWRQGFSDLKYTCGIIMKEHAKAGLGSYVKQAFVLSLDQEEYLWQNGFLGCSNPQQLLHTLLFLVGIHWEQGQNTEPWDQLDTIPNWNIFSKMGNDTFYTQRTKAQRAIQEVFATRRSEPKLSQSFHQTTECGVQWLCSSDITARFQSTGSVLHCISEWRRIGIHKENGMKTDPWVWTICKTLWRTCAKLLVLKAITPTTVSIQPVQLGCMKVALRNISSLKSQGITHCVSDHTNIPVTLRNIKLHKHCLENWSAKLLKWNTKLMRQSAINC